MLMEKYERGEEKDLALYTMGQVRKYWLGSFSKGHDPHQISINNPKKS